MKADVGDVVPRAVVFERGPPVDVDESKHGLSYSASVSLHGSEELVQCVSDGLMSDSS